jgi:SAM-dependent methyltransferase
MKTALFDRILTLLNLIPGRQYAIIDLGCGSGELLGLISSKVAAGSTLVGIDAVEGSIAKAKSMFPDIDFRQAKFIDSFSFPDAFFDIIISVDTLECIPNKTALVSEFARVVRPTGRIAIAHWDWDTQVYYSDHKDVIRNFVAAFSDWKQNWMDACDGQMGRQLWGLFESSSKFKGSMDCFTLLETRYEKGQCGFERLHDLAGLVKTGNIAAREYEMIHREMQALAKANRYFYSVNSYIYSGNRVQPADPTQTRGEMG